jgi:hypothetical protein
MDLKAMPEHFLCELCRLARADPFWRRIGHPLVGPMKLAPLHPHRTYNDGRRVEEDVLQVADRHFNLPRGTLDVAQRHTDSYQLQVRCERTTGQRVSMPALPHVR